MSAGAGWSPASRLTTEALNAAGSDHDHATLLQRVASDMRLAEPARQVDHAGTTTEARRPT